MNQVRFFAQQSLTLAQRLANQPYIAMLQVLQSAMNDARGAAGNARGEVLLLDKQSVLAHASTLPRHGDAIDAAANHHDMEALAVQAGPRIRG